MMKTLFTTVAAALGATMLLASPAAAKTFAQCDYEAKQWAVQQANPGASAVAGGIAGGLLGLGISSITGNTNTAGAIALGVGAGAVTGFIAGNATHKKFYDQYMASCLGPTQVVMPQPSAFPPPSGQAGQYKVNSLNVRVCPQANNACPSIGSIAYGQVVPVQSCNTPAPNPSGWCYVGLPQGWGWASKSYLTFY